MRVCPVCRLVLPGAVGSCAPHDAEGVEAAADEVPRTLHAQFRIRGVYAIGDTGTSYLAEELQTERSGLLKVLRVRPKAGRDSRERLVAELSSQVALGESPWLVTVRRTGLEDGVAWMFRDWVDGESLKSRLARAGQLPLVDGLVVAAQVALALNDLHRKGLVHRAVRPGHVLLRADASATPHAMLMDAAMAARNDRESALEDLGDLYYLPPECTRGDRVSFRTDLYALGCTVFDALVGEPPFEGEDAEEVMQGHQYLTPRVPRDQMPGAIAALLEHMLAKAPFDRPLSAQQIARELEPYLPEDWQEPPHDPARNVAPVAVAAAPSPRTPPPAAAPARASSSSAPPPAVPLGRVRPSSAPPPAVPLQRVASRSARPSAPAVAPSAPPPAPVHAPPPQVRSAPPPAVLAAPPPRAAHRIAPPPASDPVDPYSDDLVYPKPSSIAPAEIEATEIIRAPSSRFPRLTVGFLVGCVAMAATTWGLAWTGNFHLVTDTLTEHLAVPPSRIGAEVRSAAAGVPVTTATEAPGVGAAAEAAEVQAPEAPSAVAGADESATPPDGGAVVAEADADGGTETAEPATQGGDAVVATTAEEAATADAGVEEADEPRMTRAERRRALRQARIERRRARIRARIRARRRAMRRAAAHEARADMGSNLLF